MGVYFFSTRNTDRMADCITHLLEDINCSRNRLRIFQVIVELLFHVQ